MIDDCFKSFLKLWDKNLFKNTANEYVYPQSVHLDCSDGGLLFWNCPAERAAYYFGSPSWLLCRWQVELIFRTGIKSFRTKLTQELKWLNWTKNMDCIVTHTLTHVHTRAHTQAHTEGFFFCVFPRLNQKTVLNIGLLIFSSDNAIS